MNKYASLYLKELSRLTKEGYETGGTTLSPDEKNLVMYAGTNRGPYSAENPPWFAKGLEPELTKGVVNSEDDPGSYSSELSVPLDLAQKHKILKDFIAEAIKERQAEKLQMADIEARLSRS